MNDTELLTLAAKAVGIDLLDEEWEDGFIYYYHKIPGDTQGWNPLNCDSDALRLAVKMGLAIGINNPFHITIVSDLNGNSSEVSHNEGGTAAATRRAIVRAAAEIGKEMK